MEKEAPALFFIHGSGGRTEQWRFQFPYFAENYHLVAIDLLGHGESEKPTDSSQYHFSEMIKDLKAVFDLYKKKENFLIGHSMGAMLALGLIQQLKYENDSSVHGAIFMAPAEIQMSLYLLYFMPISCLEWMRPSINQQFLSKAYHSSTSQELIEYESKLALQNRFEVLKPLGIGLLSSRVYTKENLCLVSIPTLVLAGETDGIVSKEWPQKLSSMLPNSQFRMVSSCAHNLMMEQPQAINQIIDAFLKSVDQ